MFVILATFVLLVWGIYKLVKAPKYWEERDVPHAKAWPIVGSLKDFVLKKKHPMEIAIEIYNQHPNDRCVGFMQFTRPYLMIRDLDLIKRITVKDFDHFHDHLGFEKNRNDPLFSKSLVNLTGDKWKRMRATLSPVFTSSKMRILFNLMSECAENFCKHFQGKGKVNIEMKEVFSRFANDVIASTAFGISIDSLDDPNNEFFKMGNEFANFNSLKALKVFVIQTAPRLANMLRLQLFPEKINTFFRSLVKDNMKKRETDGIVRPDLIHLLMEARRGRLKHETTKEEEKEENFASVEESQIGRSSNQMELTDDHIVAQALIFFLAGFDTVSTSSSFMAHELALHPEVQKKLQNEVDSISENTKGKVTYEDLLSMKYLDQVVCETLRLWPPGFQTDRLCVKDYVIEPQNPKEKVVFVPKGSSVLIPIIAIHRDSKYFQNPNKFDPDRFSDENKAKILPGTYRPFGEGPRNCIGSRFALLEVKILFFHLLSKFNIVPVDETESPLKVSPRKMKLMPENGFRLGLMPRAKR